MRFGILSDLHIDLNDPSVPVAKYATRSGEARNRVLRGLPRAVQSQRPETGRAPPHPPGPRPGAPGRDTRRCKPTRRQLEGRLWQDKVRAPWGRPTRDVHRWFLKRLELRLEACRGRGPLLLVTHVIPHESFTVRPADRMWSRRFREGATLFVCNCLGYASEWGDNQDPALEAERALRTLEL